MKISPKTWRQVFIATPEGSRVQLYLGIDKNMAQQALEVATKRLSVIVGSALGTWSQYLFTMRSEGLLFVDWQPLAQVRVQEGGKVAIGWNPKVSEACALDEAALSAALTAEVRSAAEAGQGLRALRAKAAHVRWRL